MFFKEYIDFCAFSRNLAKTTIENYCKVLSMWSGFCGEHSVCVEDATSEDVLEFLTDAHKNGCKPSSCNQYLTTLGSYYNWLVRFHFDLIQANPCDEVQRMKSEKTVPVSLPRDLLDRVVSSMRDDNFKRSRSRAIFILMYHCGLRRAEVADLAIDAVDFSSRTIRVLGKGRKTRIVPMSVTLVDAMQKYVAFRDSLPIIPEAFFVQVTGQRLEYKMLNYLVRSILARFVPLKYCHPHILRHSFATICVESGVSIENVAALMGHESVSTTMRYLSISPRRLLSQMQGVF